MSKITWEHLHTLHGHYVDAMQQLAPSLKNDPVNVMMGQTAARATWEQELALSHEALRGYLIGVVEEIEGKKEALRDNLNKIEGGLLMGYLVVDIMKYHHLMEFAP